jgi:hypothetical protein
MRKGKADATSHLDVLGHTTTTAGYRMLKQTVLFASSPLGFEFQVSG